MNEGVLHRGRGRPPAHRAPPRDALPRRRWPRASTRRSPGRARPRPAGRPLSIGLLGNAADVLPELVRRGVVPDLVTDQTSAHDPLNGYVPNRHDATSRPSRLRADDPAALHGRGPAQHGRARAGHARPARRGARSSSTTATTSAPRRRRPASPNAFDFPGFVPAYIRPLFCEGKGPFRWAASPATPTTSRPPTTPSSRPSPTTGPSRRWITPGPRAGAAPGAARRASAGSATASARRWASSSTSSCARGAREGARSSSAATTSTPARSPRPTARPRRMRDGSDAVADWPILNALLNTVAGRHLGLGPPRRRRRHGLLDPRRHGRRRRRHRRRRPRASSASSPPTPAWASCATPTPATTARDRGRPGARRADPDARSGRGRRTAVSGCRTAAGRRRAVRRPATRRLRESP